MAAYDPIPECEDSNVSIRLFRIANLLTYSGDIEKYAQARHPRLLVLNERPKDSDKVDRRVERCSCRKVYNCEKGNIPVFEKRPRNHRDLGRKETPAYVGFKKVFVGKKEDEKRGSNYER